MVTIKSVKKDSLAEKHGIVSGDILLEINGNIIRDVLDYQFRLCESKVNLKLHREEKIIEVSISKDEYDDIGLIFDTYLMDEKHSCKNKCVFCFIDQLPKGMRQTLYFKDDDSRLSFLMGNYITLTNLTDEDVERIIEMKTSPINISVHTTNPELRCKMMNNRFAGKVLDYMKRFAKAGINLNCQIVLCKGLNDGNELIRTMNDLTELVPSLIGVSIVPAGLTKYRDGLYPLEPHTPEEISKVIDTVDNFAKKCLQKYGSRLFFCSDEMYIRCGRELPDEDYYEDYPQLENGVGSIRLLISEVISEFDFLDEYDTKKKRNISIATGYAAYDCIKSLTDKLCQLVPTLKINVYKIKNNFFGDSITVAGLLTGQDLLLQLKDKDLGDRLLIPSVMLRAEGDMFLDNMTICDLGKKLKTTITPVNQSGADFVSAILN